MSKPDTFLRIADLPSRKTTRFSIEPDRAELDAIKSELNLIALRKVRFVGELKPHGKSDWQLTAQLGATVVQSCVITLDPVTTRIEEPVAREYLADWADDHEDTEAELDPDDTSEELPEILDLLKLLSEALVLALPLYPRAEGAKLESAQFAEDGVAPMSDDDAKPFAGLAALKDKLDGA